MESYLEAFLNELEGFISTYRLRAENPTVPYALVVAEEKNFEYFDSTSYTSDLQLTIELITDTDFVLLKKQIRDLIESKEFKIVSDLDIPDADFYKSRLVIVRKLYL